MQDSAAKIIVGIHNATVERVLGWAQNYRFCRPYFLLGWLSAALTVSIKPLVLICMADFLREKNTVP